MNKKAIKNVNELLEVLQHLKETGHGFDELEFYTEGSNIPIATEIQSIKPDEIGHIEIVIS